VRLLVFNAGSSSLKFELMEGALRATPRRIAAGQFADVDGSGVFRWQEAQVTAGQPPAARTLAEAAEFALDWLSSSSVHGHDLLAGLGATAHRIVHGGALFRAATRLQEAELAALAQIAPLAPLHNPAALAVIATVRARFGPERPLIGVFDTAYYADLPPAAYRYAVPARWADEFGVRRYGFHGIAHRYLCESARAMRGGAGPALRIISLQLGRGCSVTATLGERAIATSMGFTPLEGLVMGTRSGDVDPAAVLYVMERAGLSIEGARRALNEESGLLGLSQRTADMRELIDLARAGDAAAALAIEVFCRRARHYVGAFLAELGGADAVVFGGGIGENCAAVRRRILGGMEWAGIVLRPVGDPAGDGAHLHAASSATHVYVVAVDEAAIIATDALRVLAPG
jgi:acetate kinase